MTALVRAGILRPMKVLIATDGRAAAKHAIHEAIRLLALRDAEVFLVSVLDPEERIGGNEDAEQDLDDGIAILAAAGIDASKLLRRGHFAEQIVAQARELHADMIVVGSEAHSKLTQLLVGSVSSDVIKKWDGAVLVVRSASAVR